ncbi:MAG: acetate--CoA ligase family protein [Pseudomonadota bacterium]
MNPSTATSTRQLNIARLLRPQSIAFIGGAKLQTPIKACEAIGFAGDIWTVNPTRPEIAGYDCFPSVAALPAAPDAVFLSVPSAETPKVLRDLASIGAGGVICYAAGFAETGGDGRALQEDLIRAAGDMAVVGPNCYGLLNYLDGAALWADVHGGEKLESGVAVISQSGNIALNLTMAERSVPLAQVISVGNQAVLSIHDFIHALVDDPRITAIGLYLEGLSDIPAFSRAAEYALAKGKPIVAVKVGTSETAAQLALSHTSSLAGSDQLYDALFQRLGVIRAPSLTCFLESLKLLHVSGPLVGGRLGVLTCSGGDAALVADMADKCGLTIPPLTPAQEEDLRSRLNHFTAVANPLDYNTAIWGDGAGLKACFQTVMEGPVDATLLVIDYPRAGSLREEDWDIAVEALIAASEDSGKLGVLVASLPELLPERARRRALEAGLPPLQGLDEAVLALGSAHWYEARQRSGQSDAEAGRLGLPHLKPVEGPVHSLNEWDSKVSLSAAGLLVPEGRLVSANDCSSVAESLRFPLVVKAVSSDLEHKSEAGAVALNLNSIEEVKSAVAGMSRLSDRFLIEEMQSGAVCELIIGVKRDEQFGLALVVGSGGILVNLIEDSASLLLPTDRKAVETALSTLKADRLLAGYRGKPAGDREAVIQSVLAVAAWAEQNAGRLYELDVNPLIVLSEGQGAVAVDALIRMADA